MGFLEVEEVVGVSSLSSVAANEETGNEGVE
jgi:hypothetical protein